MKNAEEIVSKLIKIMCIDKKDLCCMIGISEKTLSSWNDIVIGERSERLIRLLQVVEIIKQKYPNVKGKDFKYFLYDTRIPIEEYTDFDEDEDNTFCLLGCIQVLVDIPADTINNAIDEKYKEIFK